MLGARADLVRRLWLVVAAVCTPALALAAQDHPIMLELGAGSLAPDDPFQAFLSFRGSAGWILSHRDALAIDYTRQTKSRATSEDLGKYARQFLGLAWHHSFQEAFYDDETLRQQYFFKLSAGLLVRGRTPTLGSADLANAPFVGAALAIRYPLSSRIAAVGEIEDDMAFIPRQTVDSIRIGGELQHNFGLFILVQWRP
ncbi:MAG TPA: hypothetical protein VFO67_05065 [Gemmatimonadales bacterium]|nr:hypothetical protein [Gemmatimonadales bacterium]